MKGLPWVAFTYGFISACGQGIALIPTMTIGMRWFPNHKVDLLLQVKRNVVDIIFWFCDMQGLAMGVVVGGFGGGAFIFNQIQVGNKKKWCLIKKIVWVFFQTAILNPNNISTEGLYFEDPNLLGSHFTLLCFIKCKTLYIFLVKIIFAARVPSLLVFLAGLYLTLQMVNNPETVFNWFWFCFSSSLMFRLMRSQVACFMVTEPSIDEELVPKSEDVNGNQEILMDQVLSKSSFLLPSSEWGGGGWKGCGGEESWESESENLR